MKKDNILIIINIILVVIILISTLFKSNHVEIDAGKDLQELIKKQDSIYAEIGKWQKNIDSLRTSVDSSKANIIVIKEIRYEKINSIDNLTPDSVLSILTIYLSKKGGNR